MRLDEMGDGLFEFCHAAEDAAGEALLGKLCEETFDNVQPGTAGGREVHVKTSVSLEPGLHFGMFMGGVVVNDQMNRARGRSLAVDEVEELDPLLMAVPFL